MESKLDGFSMEDSPPEKPAVQAGERTSSSFLLHCTHNLVGLHDSTSFLFSLRGRCRRRASRGTAPLLAPDSQPRAPALRVQRTPASRHAVRRAGGRGEPARRRLQGRRPRPVSPRRQQGLDARARPPRRPLLAPSLRSAGGLRHGQALHTNQGVLDYRDQLTPTGSAEAVQTRTNFLNDPGQPMPFLQNRPARAEPEQPQSFLSFGAHAYLPSCAIPDPGV
eukprot:3462911-Rhodomonas_salina.1